MSVATTASVPNRRGAFLRVTRLFNRVVLLLAGTRLLPLYGVISHRGRRSGKDFRTPVVVRATHDGFVVPMPWGLTTDWYRNVVAAGECVIRWKGRDYDLVQPEVLEGASARAAFDAVQRAGMQRFGIRYCLHLRHKGDGSPPPSRD